MTETLNPVEAYMPPDVASQEAAREQTLQALMPNSYDLAYAKDAGLVDMFYFDPQTGEDGLVHTLAGSIRQGTDGSFIAEGFHHEPSGAAVWPEVATESGPLPSTRVDRTHLDDLPSKKRAGFKEHPLEPYNAKVIVNGLGKHAIRADAETGEITVAAAKNTMYPKEYDAMAVLQAIKAAYGNRDRQQDQAIEDGDGRRKIVSEGEAILLDGKSTMKIRLVLDADTEKIITAIPIAPQRPGVMRLTNEEADNLAYNVM